MSESIVLDLTEPKTVPNKTELNKDSLENGGQPWDTSLDRIREVCSAPGKKLVVFDTDATWFDLYTGQIRPGFNDLLHDLKTSPDMKDTQIAGWSLLGSEHVRDAAMKAGVSDLFDGFYQKPARTKGQESNEPFTQAQAIETFGMVPTITVDDLSADAVAGTEQAHVQAYCPPRVAVHTPEATLVTA